MKSLLFLPLVLPGAWAQTAIFNSIAATLSSKVAALDAAVRSYTGGNGAQQILNAHVTLYSGVYQASNQLGSATLADCAQVSAVKPAFDNLAVAYHVMSKNVISKSAIINSAGFNAAVASIATSQQNALSDLAKLKYPGPVVCSFPFGWPWFYGCPWWIFYWIWWVFTHSSIPYYPCLC